MLSFVCCVGVGSVFLVDSSSPCVILLLIMKVVFVLLMFLAQLVVPLLIDAGWDC